VAIRIVGTAALGKTGPKFYPNEQARTIGGEPQPIRQILTIVMTKGYKALAESGADAPAAAIHERRGLR